LRSQRSDTGPLDDEAIAALTLLKAGPVPRDGQPRIAYSTATLLITRRLIEESHVAYSGMIATTRQRVYRITPDGLAALSHCSGWGSGESGSAASGSRPRGG
jgi:hypothetical protein